MKEYYLPLDEIGEEIFHELENIQDGKYGHVVMFLGENKGIVAHKICTRLYQFFIDRVKENII